MNYGYIKEEIFNLAFETQEEYSEKFSIVTQAINRAIQTICNEVRPILGKYQISQYPLKNLLPNPLYNQNVKHYDGEPIIYTASGAKSYYFECDGTGTATITDDDGIKTLNMTGNRVFKEYRGFCNGNVTITFSGFYSYNIKNVAVYGEKFSADVKDIPPYKQNIFYDLDELTKVDGKVVFMGFADIVQEGDLSDGTYKQTIDIKKQGRSTLILNGFEKCQFTVFFKKLPTVITESTPNTFEMELDTDLHVLIPLLAGYYVWQDDNKTLAANCYNDYQEKKNAILGKETKVVAVVNGGDIW